MPENAPPQTQSTGEPVPAQNRAVARCSDAWTRAYQAEMSNSGKVGATFRAGRAYCSAMPPLDGSQNIRDFIACIAHGSLLGAINDSQCGRLLYAAQVALSADRSQPRPPKP